MRDSCHCSPTAHADLTVFLPTVFTVARAQCRALPASHPSGSDLPPLLQTPVPGAVSGDAHLLSALWGASEELIQGMGEGRVERCAEAPPGKRLARLVGNTWMTPGKLWEATDCLLPNRLCCSPPFILDTLGGSPAEVSLPFPPSPMPVHSPKASATSSLAPE